MSVYHGLHSIYYLHQTISSKLSQKIIDVSGDDIVLNVNQAIPCRILVSELVNNSYKHAFPESGNIGGSEKKIQIDIRQKQDTVLLSVGDNGIGLPSEFDYRNISSPGYTLIHSLAEQLEGKIVFENKGGTAVTCRFKKAEIKGSASSFMFEEQPDHKFN